VSALTMYESSGSRPLVTGASWGMLDRVDSTRWRPRGRRRIRPHGVGGLRRGEAVPFRRWTSSRSSLTGSSPPERSLSPSSQRAPLVRWEHCQG
jgi:hypothetical protein